MRDTMKKRSLKRKIAFTLALAMIGSFSQTIGASVAFNSPAVVYASAADTTEVIHPEDDSKLSKIDVTISNQLGLGSDFECTVTLTRADADGNALGNSIAEETVTLGAKRNATISTNLPYIGNGTYIVEVKAPGFATFTQVIEDVENEFCTVRLTAGFQAGYTYKDTTIEDADGDTQVIKQKHPGVLVVGDVDGEGSINDVDEEMLVKAIDQGANVNNSDLNRDTRTDLADLQFFAKGYVEGKDNDTAATIERRFSPLAVKVETSEGTSLADNSDSIEDLFNEEKEEVNVLLKPTGEGEISVDNPVGIDIDPSKIDFSKCEGIEIKTNAMVGVVVVEEGDGHKEEVGFVDGAHGYSGGESAVCAELEGGKIKINVGNQIAVKKITLKITAVQVSEGINNLAQIGKVEFVNGMEDRISEPQMDIPQSVIVTQTGDMKITTTWTPCVNVTEYEVQVATDRNFYNQIKTSPYVLTVPTITLESEHGNFKLIKNNTTYYVRVRSLNGDWHSDWSAISEVRTEATKKPDKPDMVKATGGFRCMKVSWNADNTNSTDSYSVYYRVRGTEDAYQEAVTTTTSCEITGLKDLTEYEMYVVGHNKFGDSPVSNSATTTTTNLDLADMPRYNLINRDENGNPGSTHIVSVTRNGGEMVDSELDNGSNNTAWGAVDGDKASYYSKNTWDDGGFNNLGGNGLVYTFDQEYTMDTIGILTTKSIDYTNLRWWDKDGKELGSITDAYTNISVRKTDANGKYYYVLKFSSPITASKIQIGLARYGASPVTIAETYFYHYDPLMDEIMGLYVDDLHTVLRSGVTEETIDALKARVNAPDEFGNYNTDMVALNKEIETARKILNAQHLSSAVTIHKEIVNDEPGRNFSGLNAWQPLGVTMGTNETVTVYVGGQGKKTGDGTDLRLVVTQYNSESGNYELSGANLTVGANTIKFTKSVYSDVESGGSMYVYHKNTAANTEYSIRVDGGTEIPVLDLYGVTDEAVRKERAVEYINKLDAHVDKLEELHEKDHKASTYMNGNNEVPNTKLNMAYNERTCIAGATEIMCDSMMYSLPAKQIQAGLGSGTVETRAETLLQSMDAMEDMVHLFYQHKGLNANASATTDKIPVRHLNIRYQRMFQGAFMYAAGNHIGIQWGSAAGMVNCKGVTSDENGKYVSGSYFGWGIAHEIGHCLNDSNYVVAEITNNYYSMLAQAQDTNIGSRLNYNNIFKKVTSGTKGSADQGTQLGMYWQLHLAYDQGYNFKTYEKYDEQLANLFYARMDTYSRTPSRAPYPQGGIPLSLSGNSDQKLMRLACAAAQKNVLEFFQRWGKTPDAATTEYAAQFPKETRAIMYANESSRTYALTHEGSSLTEGGNAIDNISVSVGSTAATANKVDLTITKNDGISAEDVLGYEIIRCTTSGGKVTETPAGFVTGDKVTSTGATFTDTVMTINNRTVFYKVTLIDQYLNRSEVFTTGMVKIQHDGSLDKAYWIISTQNLAAEAESHDADEKSELPCDKIVSNPAQAAIDNDLNKAYVPEVKANNAEIIIDFNQTLTVTGLKYTAGDTTDGNKAIGAYKVSVMAANEWIEVANGTFDGSKTIYFSNSDDKYISTYDATAVKLEILDQAGANISIAELDVLGVTGDNVDFRRADETAAFGVLAEAYQYGTKVTDVIPEGSIVFTGAYKGNPAYNVVILYDEKGRIVGGIDEEGDVKAQQIILADVPDGGNIADVSDGTWIYWIESNDIEGMAWPEKVRVELYRVNDALTNKGQRMVSDSLFADVAARGEMAPITIGGDRKFAANSNTEVTVEDTTEGGETE